jgi:hypothetical protein
MGRTHTTANLKWIESDGGPLVLMSRELLPYWGGYDQFDLDPLDPAHDYGRACSVNDYLGVLPVGPGDALVSSAHR